MSIKLLPSQIANRVLIEQDNADEQIGSLHIPEGFMEKPLRGRVISVSEYYNCPKNGIVYPFVKVGDTVLYEKHTGTTVELSGKDFVLLMEYNIFAVL